MTHDDWAELHRDIFAMTTDREEELLAVWVKLFKEKGFTPDELAAASKALATNESRCNQREHVQALSRLVNERREEAAFQRRILENANLAEHEREQAAPPGSLGKLLKKSLAAKRASDAN